ncbi:hypothetical protein A3Q56_04021 [Intoshia linei]|uniref:Uncharacterized protein n=1 Tax=Intoshia linei TaxID=1819745 RepID=A0A177B3P9_9BILA|nr:hypothetical protein A3Q56_04021 [Intoshia linei]
MEVIEDICEIETYPQFYKYLSFFLIFLIVLVFTGIVAVGIKSYANRIDEIPIEYEEVITSTNNDEVDSLDIKTNIN